jgi:hypothetical protein
MLEVSLVIIDAFPYFTDVLIVFVGQAKMHWRISVLKKRSRVILLVMFAFVAKLKASHSR